MSVGGWVVIIKMLTDAYRGGVLVGFGKSVAYVICEWPLNKKMIHKIIAENVTMCVSESVIESVTLIGGWMSFSFLFYYEKNKVFLNIS